MRSPVIFILSLCIPLLASPAISIQIGPEIRVGGGEATIGGLGKKKGGGLAVPTLDQVIDAVINTSPLVVLSEPDKKNVKAAIKTTGYIAAVVSDPVSGIIVISVLEGGEKKDVPVPTVDAPQTGKTWTFKSKCILQQDGGLITAMFNDDPDHIKDIKDGDTISLQAEYCSEYKKRSVTAVKIKYTGRSDFPDAKPPRYKHYLVGKTT